MLKLAIAGVCLVALSACAASDMTQVQTDVNAGCAVATIMGASATVENDCATEQILEPAVAPLMTKP